MKKFLIVSRGWMGDTLLVSSLASLIKPSHPNSEITLMTSHPSMNEVLQSIPGVDKVINGNSFQQYDEVIDVTLPHLFEEDPITTYTIEYLKDFNINEFQNFEGINHEKLPNVDFSIDLPKDYITIQSDWQNRTRLDVNKITKLLDDNNIKYVLTNKQTSIAHGSYEDNKSTLLHTCYLLKNSNLHLGMLGGSIVLASYMGVPTITTTDLAYANKNWNYRNPSTKNNIETPKDFIETFKILPEYWCKSSDHITAYPDINEEQLVELVLNKIKK